MRIKILSAAEEELVAAISYYEETWYFLLELI
jgi:hypothetical protein